MKREIDFPFLYERIRFQIHLVLFISHKREDRSKKFIELPYSLNIFFIINP